jgi:hypothetical protein
MASEPRIYWRVTWSDETGDSKVEQPVGPFTQYEAAAWVAGHDETVKWPANEVEPLKAVDG